MRYYVNSNTGPSIRAKHLKRALVSAGYSLGLMKCQGLLAKMMGYRDWSEMLAHIGQADPSLGDAFVGEQERERRRERHVAVLVKAGVEAGDAEAVVDAVGPTNYGEPRRREDDEQDAGFMEEWGLRPRSR